MLNYQSKYFLQSAPFKIVWAGFESDTLRLQNNGWTLAVEDNYDFVCARHYVRFILRHAMLDLYCVTAVNAFDFHELSEYFNYSDGRLPFNIQVIGKDIRYMPMQEINLACVKEIDARPEFIEYDVKSIKDLCIFKTLITPDNALIVEPDRISELLEKIVAAQAPNQAEIRDRIKRAEARDSLKQTLHAQILSVAA